ncbi:hypothetical protein [Pseudobacteriovorax antillogorgiicola]|uniref:Tetratricopeptide repeat-containing protein n=1 Tax=Pseudobacteriovorax antillogorgiicola TaxID=1513793 RepID=A0A1Y6CVB2_9BACT|nr:hypothetical protein [Pseudobacteriovorax antillogorgiicola]TCS42851.1 hypothetical protein EDD56_13917 [Pseudobacteriovorax antillogorgiicola]SMF81854.1 hypothetical protein SAMN06296036_13815 [Pseudobacteriovorax antillogorgiicola]
MKRIIFSIFLSLVISSHGFSNRAERVDIRHLADDLLTAYPDIHEFAEFLSKLDLDDDWDDLEEESQEREKRLKQLDSIPIATLPIGKRFTVHREMIELIEKQIIYLAFRRDHRFYNLYQKWLIELESEKPKRFDQDLQNHQLKGLEIARTMANTYEKLEPEYSQYTLIKFYVFNKNENFDFYYKKFRRSHPKSNYIPELDHLAGEYYFSEKKWDRASSLFVAALKNKSSKIRPYTAFKLAWTQLFIASAAKKKSDRDKAEKKADAAFRLSLKLMDDWSEYKPVFPLMKEASTDLAWYWGSQNVPEARVKKYFKDIDQEWATAEYYFYRGITMAQKKNAEGMEESFQKLFAFNKEAKKLPRYHLKLIELSMQLQAYDVLVESFKSMQKLLDKEGEWFDEWEDNKPLIELTRNQIPYYLRTTAINLHQQVISLSQSAQNLKSQAQQKAMMDKAQALLKVTNELYELFYNNYPDQKGFDDIAFNYGNIKYEMGDMKGALGIFSKVARMDASTHRQSAAYNGVMAAFNMVQQDKPPTLPEPGKAEKPVPLPEAQQALIQQIDFFVKNFPKADERVSSEYTAAQILYDFGHYPDAFKRFAELAISHPKTAEGENAMRTILSYHWERKEWTQVVKTANKFIIEPAVVAAGHEKFLEETLSYAKSQAAVSKK